MLFGSSAASAAFLLAIGGVSTLAQEVAAPPPPPPNIFGSKVHAATLAQAPVAASPVQFSVGDPTDDEQLYLELINRARKDAPAEATRLLALTDPFIVSARQFFMVDPVLMQQQFGTNPPVPPLSFNAKLIAAARGHTQYQFDTGTQTHIGPGTNTLTERLQAVAYPFARGGENVFANARSAEHGHAGFDIDWGPGPGGMQAALGHRVNIHSPNFVEVGIGVINGTNTVPPNSQVGPQLVTQDFGAQQTPFTYVTGVAYYDLNGNNFYDLGEGLSGVTVTVDGVNTFAVTTTSGAYSVPVPPNQSHTVRFNVPGLAETVVPVTVTTANVKVDFKPTFVPTIVNALAPHIYAGAPNALKFTTLPGATGYRARVYSLTSPAPEGAETPTGNYTLTVTGGYNPISTAAHASGAKSFHFGHVNEPDTENPGFDLTHPQFLTFSTPFYVRIGAKVEFSSRLGISSSGETARLEVSTDDGATWTTVWSQAGITVNTDNSEKTFSAKSVSLSSFARSFVKLRFNYDVDMAQGWFPLADDGYGWYLDDIVISNSDQVSAPAFTTLNNSGTFLFTPSAPGNYVVDVQAMAGARSFPFGLAQAVTALADPPSFTMLNNTTLVHGTVMLHFQRTAGASVPVAIESASDIKGPWTVETSATITEPVSGQFSAAVASNGNARFYRVATN